MNKKRRGRPRSWKTRSTAEEIKVFAREVVKEGFEEDLQKWKDRDLDDTGWPPARQWNVTSPDKRTPDKQFIFLMGYERAIMHAKRVIDGLIEQGIIRTNVKEFAAKARKAATTKDKDIDLDWEAVRPVAASLGLTKQQVKENNAAAIRQSGDTWLKRLPGRYGRQRTPAEKRLLANLKGLITVHVEKQDWPTWQSLADEAKLTIDDLKRLLDILKAAHRIKWYSETRVANEKGKRLIFNI